MKDINLHCLEKYYLHNTKSAYLYHQLTMGTKKVLLKNLYQRLYRQKRSFKNALKIHLLLMVDQDYIKNLEHQEKEVPLNLQVSESQLPPLENNRRCLQMEKKLYEQYTEAVKKVTNKKVRDTLLFHQEQTGNILEEMKFIDRYLI